jgi:hypothetical protein
MDYSLAMMAGRTAMAMVALSCGYYLLHIILVALERRDMDVWRLRSIVKCARISHPYLASLISLSVIYHVYVMWMTHPLGAKIFSGIGVSTMVALMANSGWALRLRLNSRRLRQAHLLGMYILFLVLAGHHLL